MKRERAFGLSGLFDNLVSAFNDRIAWRVLFEYTRRP